MRADIYVIRRESVKDLRMTAWDLVRLTEGFANEAVMR